MMGSPSPCPLRQGFGGIKGISHGWFMSDPQQVNDGGWRAARDKRLIKFRASVFCALAAVFCALGIPSACAETLDLEAIVVTGESSIDFGNLRSLDASGAPLGDSSVRQVRLSVVSDLGRPYLITQMLQDYPVNPDGSVLEEPAVRFSITVEQGRGIVRTGNLEPLRPGAQEIYISSDNEEQTVLLINYDFLVPPGQKAGRYQGIVTYRADSR